MEKQLKGIATILLSILLILGFESIDRGWATYVFDLSLHWSTVFMAIGVVGFLMVFHKEK